MRAFAEIELNEKAHIDSATGTRGSLFSASCAAFMKAGAVTLFVHLFSFESSRNVTSSRPKLLIDERLFPNIIVDITKVKLFIVPRNPFRETLCNIAGRGSLDQAPPSYSCLFSVLRILM
jgi:hypothetical protein